MRNILSKNKSHLGYYFVILAAALAALLHVISKPMLEMGENTMEINPMVMTFLVYIICGAFFTPVAKNTNPVRKIPRRDILFMILIGLSEVAALSTYFFGLQNSTAVNASLFSNSEIIFSLIIAMIVFREKLQIKEYVPFSMVIGGMMVIPITYNIVENGQSLLNIVTGDILIILSGFLYAVDITICKYIGDRYDTRRVAQLTSFICAIFALIVIILLEIPMIFDIAHLPNIAIIAVLGTGMSTLLFLAGLKLIGAVRTILLYSTSSVFGIMFAGIFLAEEITVVDIISLTITLSGIVLLRNKLAESESDEQVTKTHDSNPNILRTNIISKIKYLSLKVGNFNQSLNIISNNGNIQMHLHSAIIIDDDDNIAKLLAEMLNIQGFKVLEVGHNGEDAIDLFRKHNPHFIFMDVNMPKKNGQQALKEIRKQSKNVKVAMISAYISSSFEKELIENGADTIIRKPLSIDKVMQSVNKIESVLLSK